MGFPKVLILFLCVSRALSDEDEGVGVDPHYLDELMEAKQYEAVEKMTGADANLIQSPPPGDETLSEDVQVLCQTNITNEPPTKWKNGLIPIYVKYDDFSEKDQQKLYDGLDSWNKQVPEVQFTAWQPNDTDYVYVIKGSGCFSAIGKTGGPQPLILHPHCLTPDTIHHEMMHTIGFSHEHNRRDRDDYVEVLWDNIRPVWRHQYTKVSCRIPNLLGPYEYLSNMHYLNYAPGTTDPAFDFFRPVDERKTREPRDLSEEDKRKIHRFYTHH